MVYGDYDLEETMKPDYELANGTGEVTVDDKTEEFTITNRNLTLATVIATKVMCDDEQYLPNWGADANMPARVNENTATDWVNQSDGHCWLEEGRYFEWGRPGAGDPGGDFVGPAGDPWNTFGPTDANGMAQVNVSVNDNQSFIWMREVLEQYDVPFTFESNRDDSDNYSAEFYCNTDAYHYDNWDRIDGFDYGKTYYCVGFNAPSKSKIEGYKFNDENANGKWDRVEPNVDTLSKVVELPNGEQGLPGWEIALRDEEGNILAETTTDENGYYSFTVNAGKSYFVTENQKEGWYQTTPGEENQSKCDVANTRPDYMYGCDFGNVELGTIKGIKFQDINNSGGDFEDGIDKPLADWSIYIDYNQNNSYDSGDLLAITDENGAYGFEGLIPGTYQICEIQKTGYQQNYPTEDTEGFKINNGCYVVTIPDTTENTNYNFGNGVIPVKAELSESNDATSEMLLNNPNLTVRFIITLKAIGDNGGVLMGRDESTGEPTNVVRNLLPSGFTYHPGSYKVLANGADVTSLVPEPVYHSPGSWDLSDLGNIPVGSVIEMSFIADVDSAKVDPGIVKDVSWATVTTVDNSTEYANATGDGNLPDSEDPSNVFVGTDVAFATETKSPEAEAKVEDKEEVVETTDENGKVLGASTTALPATGSSSALMILILSMLALGAGALLYGIRPNMLVKNAKTKKRKAGRKQKKIITSMILVVFLGTLFYLSNVKVAKAEESYPMIVRVEEPKTPTNETFGLTFSAVDTGQRKMVAKCQVKKPNTTNFVDFQTIEIEKSESYQGDSKVCDVTNDVLSTGGTYEFRVLATAGDDNAYSTTVTVDYSSENPDKPKDFEVEKKNDCEYKIKFKTADDGKTSYVEVYRSDEKKFSVGEDKKVKTITIGPNEKYEYTDTVAGSTCGKTQYYAIRAFDKYDNPSDVVAQENVVIVEKTVTNKNTTEEATTEPEEALVVVPGSSTVAPGGTTGETVVVPGEEANGGVLGEIAKDQEGQIKGAETENTESQNKNENNNGSNETEHKTLIQKIFSLTGLGILAVVVLLIIGVIVLL